MRRIRITAHRRHLVRFPELDLRAPSGRPLPY
jgi:hypothetical protein